MKKVCAMAGMILNPEKPGQSIHELKEAGIHEVMFDFGLIVSPVGILLDRSGEEPQFKPERTERSYRTIIGQFREHGFLPSVARLPFIGVQTDSRGVYAYEDLNRLILQIALDCIRACEEMGCSNIIVQPLSVGLERDKIWEANREFFLKLAAGCHKEGTKLFLTNQCRSHNGHLLRGICSDGAEAAAWIDALNKAAETERFAFCLDIGNCNLCGQNMQSMAASLNSRIQAVILTENNGKNMAKLLPFTSAYGRSSTMDWLSVIRGLRDISFDGYLILETVDTTVAFSPLLQPYLAPVYKALLDYFEMQINIERDLKKYKRVALFGAGNMCRNYMKCYGGKYPPLFTCDNNPKLWNTEFEGLMVKNPEELKNLPEDCGVIICNIFYREIEAQLRAMGIGNIGYFNDEYMPSFYVDRLKREMDDAGDAETEEEIGMKRQEEERCWKSAYRPKT
ncbi:MAG: sugar phosphate isomerase/epimerase [Blautia sp.]|nr:sugar phosphate isomerase/epimerase [Blautia sp.]MCM1200757.1 sugar phosphate isomerase/epimerase [Bacteroides fragilis]